MRHIFFTILVFSLSACSEQPAKRQEDGSKDAGDQRSAPVNSGSEDCATNTSTESSLSFFSLLNGKVKSAASKKSDKKPLMMLSTSDEPAKCPSTRSPYFCDEVYDGYDEAPFFNAKYYLDNNPDVREVYGPKTANAIAHWREHGHKEPVRKPSRAFDPEYYLEQNADVLALAISLESEFPRRVTAIRHYLKYGKNEKRIGAPATSQVKQDDSESTSTPPSSTDNSEPTDEEENFDNDEETISSKVKKKVVDDDDDDDTNANDDCE
jgi:hypothetical protein